MSFDIDTSNEYFAKAVALRETFAVDASARDKRRGRPLEQLALLKESGLLTLVVPEKYGGSGQPWSIALKIVRELAKADGSMAHLFGYHTMNVALGLFEPSGHEEQLLNDTVKHRWFWSNAANSFSQTLLGRKVDGGFVLNGFKPFTSGSHISDYFAVQWIDEIDGKTVYFARIPTTREGVTPLDDWDGIGQTQTGSGTTRFENVHVGDHELMDMSRSDMAFPTLAASLAHGVLADVFIGSAQGALIEARDYVLNSSRPWVESGVDRHIDDPWVRRIYGDLYTKTLAATALQDNTLASLDKIWTRGLDLTAAERGDHAILQAASNIFATEVGLEVGTRLFEVMGARSATTRFGFDRYWRNIRTHSLHNPAEYKRRNVGYWFLSGAHPKPGVFQ